MIEINLFLAGVIVTIITGVIGYFLKGVMEDVRELKKQVNDNKNQLDILKAEQQIRHDQNLREFEEMKEALRDNIKESKELRLVIGELRVEFSKKKD